MSDGNKNKMTIRVCNLSLSTVLFVVFLVLKLTGYISWSWWWVTAPLWVGPAVIFGIALCFGLLYVLYKLMN